MGDVTNSMERSERPMPGGGLDHMEMKIDSHISGDGESLVVSVSGGIDWTSSCTLMSQIDHCLTADHPARLIVDLKDVFRIDGLRQMFGNRFQASRVLLPIESRVSVLVRQSGDRFVA